MINDRNTAEAAPRLPWSFLVPWLSKRRAILLAGIAILGTGIALNWNWLTAIGAAPILLSLAPCLVMCALGLCMRGGANGSCSNSTERDGLPPTTDGPRP